MMKTRGITVSCGSATDRAARARQAYAKAETEARECEAENEAKTEAKELS